MQSDELRQAYGFTETEWPEAPANSYERVMDFHAAFGHPIATKPTTISGERATLRLALILEEAIELADALGFYSEGIGEAVDYALQTGPVVEPDLVAVADALGDLEYVVNGAAIEHGIDLPEVVKEIHESNLTKLGEDGNPIYREDGKVLKGPHYREPDIAKVLYG